MTTIPNNKDKEPALSVGVTGSSLVGVIFLVDQFFPNLLNEQQETLTLVIGALVLPIVTAILIRKRVWSPASVQETVDQAIADAIKVATKSARLTNISPPVADEFKDNL